MRFITAELTCLSDQNSAHILQKQMNDKLYKHSDKKTDEFRL